MSSKLLILICFSSIFSLFRVHAAPELSGLKCGYLNDKELIDPNSTSDDSDSDESSSDESNKYYGVNSTEQCQNGIKYCIAAAILDKTGIRIIQKSCWGNYEPICAENCTIEFKHDYFASSKNSTPTYCCCSTDNCNNFPDYFISNKTETPKIIPTERSSNLFSPYTICIGILIIMLVSLIGFVIMQLKRRVMLTSQQKLSHTQNPKEAAYFSDHKNIDNLKVVSIIGEGRFGTVWEGVLNEKPVAIKIFSSSKKQNFYNELDIYSKPLLNRCPQLLTYFGYDERVTSDGNKEYLLILSLAEKGSLQKFLKTNIIDFAMFCRLTLSIARGLSYLHTKIVEKQQTKLTICHRDLNPRNILVKDDFTCALCDFGYAICVDGPRYLFNGEMILAQTKSLSEVGTIRYLAPEMLEGSVNLRDCENALKQIDVYSLGLVIWELAMRCKDFYKTSDIPEYKAAYEDELGSCPNFDQMRNLVLQQNARPKFSDDLNNDENLCVVRDICQDLWDHDPDARVSSSCIEDRLQQLALALIPADLSPKTARSFAVFIDETRMKDSMYYTSKIEDSEIELDNSTRVRSESSKDKDFESIRIENVSSSDDRTLSSTYDDDKFIDNSDSKSSVFNIFRKPEACIERLKDVAAHIKTPGDVPASVRRTNKGNGKQFTLVKKANVNDM